MKDASEIAGIVRAIEKLPMDNDELKVRAKDWPKKRSPVVAGLDPHSLHANELGTKGTEAVRRKVNTEHVHADFPYDGQQASETKQGTKGMASAASDGNSLANMQQDQTMEDLLDTLYRLFKKKQLQLKTLAQMSEAEVKAVVRRSILLRQEKAPIADSLRTENERFGFLSALDHREKGKKETILSTGKKGPDPLSSAVTPTKPSDGDKLPSVRKSSKRDKPSPTTNKSMGDEKTRTPKHSVGRKKQKLDQDHKKSLVGQRVAKYFRGPDGNKQLYPGKVLAFFPSKEVSIAVDLWYVRFDDGDEEDVEYHELLTIMKQYKQNRHLFLK